MRLKALANHNRVVRLEDWNGLDLTGTNDMQSTMLAAAAQAVAAGYPLVLPATTLSGGLLIGTTFNLPDGLTMCGAGGSYQQNYGKTRFIPGMTDGTACLSGNVVAAHGLDLRDFCISTTAANPSAAANCIGLKVGTINGAPFTDYDISRSAYRNIQVSGVRYGVQALGWNNTFSEIQVHKCVLGFHGQVLNSTLLDLITENCEQAFSLKWSHSLTILRLQDEGAYGTVASLIDASSDIIISHYYAEAASRGEVPWLKIGTASGGTTCKNIRILSGSVSGAGVSTHPIELDDLDGYLIDVQYATGTNRRGLKRTALTKNEYQRHGRVDSGYPYYASAAHTKKRAENFLPNENSEGLRHGAKNVYVSGVTRSEETTLANLRVGASCTKLTLTAGAAYAFEQLEYDDAWVASEFAGKTATFAAWVYIPNIASMSAAPTPTIPPSVGIRSWNGAASSDVAFSSLYALSAGWNLLSVTGTIPADCVELHLLTYVNRSASTAGTGSEYLLVNGRYLCLGDAAADIDNGNVTRSHSCRGEMSAGCLTMRMTIAQAAVYIADADQVHKTGDTIEYTDPVAAGNAGQKLTTTGWKAFGVIAA